MSVLFTGGTNGSPADVTSYNSNWNLLEASLFDLGPYVISGLTASAGTGLSVNITSGTASIGGQVVEASTFTIGGLTPSTTNHLYLQQDGTGTANTSGTAPANSVKLGTCVTGASSVTSVAANWASGRQQKQRTESLVMGNGAGNPRSLNLASWAASGSEGQECIGVLPDGAVAGCVSLTPATTARNTVTPSADGASALVLQPHSATASAPTFDVLDSTGNSQLRVWRSGLGQSCNIRSRNDADLALNVYGNSGTQSANVFQVIGDGTNVHFAVGNNKLAFYGATPAAKPTLAGNANGNPALVGIRNALATLGLVAKSATVTDPTTQSWSGTNMTGATLTTGTETLYLAAPSNSGDSLRVQTIAVPSTPYTRTLGFIPSLFATNYQLCGMCLMDNSGKLITVDCTFNSALNSQSQSITVTKWSGTGTFSATYATTPTNIIAAAWHAGPCMWFQIQDDGTHRTYYISNDGVNFQQILQTTSSDFITPTKIGFYVDSNNSSLGCGMEVVSWN